MGDALAVALIHRRNFQEKDFFKFHPGGSLGSRLRAKVRDVMIRGNQIPRVDMGATLLDAIKKMDETNKGFVLVTDVAETLLGILTDGDVRRLVRTGLDFKNQRIESLMTRSPKSIRQNISVALTVEMMQRMEITTLVVTDDENRIQGYVHLHDILGRGGTLKMTLSE